MPRNREKSHELGMDCFRIARCLDRVRGRLRDRVSDSKSAYTVTDGGRELETIQGDCMSIRFDHHHYRHNDPRVDARLGVIEQKLGLILANQEKIMALADDLKAAMTDLSTAVTDGIAEIEALLTKIANPGTSDADVAAAIAQAQGIASGIRAEVDKAKAAAP